MMSTLLPGAKIRRCLGRTDVGATKIILPVLISCSASHSTVHKLEISDYKRVEALGIHQEVKSFCIFPPSESVTICNVRS